jgi:hypothetical protein
MYLSIHEGRNQLGERVIEGEVVRGEKRGVGVRG